MEANRYCRAVIREIETHPYSNEAIGSVDSIYFGGGTPSTLAPDSLSGILQACHRRFLLCESCEISIEANPGTLTHASIDSYARSGVTRISMGAQSFNDQELSAIGRIHTSAMVKEALNLLKTEGFGNLNIDLMLGLPGQTVTSWRKNLNEIALMEIPHVSVYMLDLDEPCPLAERVAKGEVRLPDEDLVSDLYLETIDFMAALGYRHYEISNFALSGHECRHNLKYWTRKPVYGFGLGSHSFDGRSRWANAAHMDDYLTAIENGQSAVEWKESVGERQEIQETLFLSLRMSEGIDWRSLQSIYGENALSKQLLLLQDLAGRGLAELSGSKIRLTPSGMLVSNEIFQLFV
jgi:oxygen-independent coproporphyrinogen-3 oxidase